ncbi:hypothetical protein BDA96_01G014200, partial [Sorghum bicolor]
AAIFSTRTRSGARIGDASRCSCAREACTLLLQLQLRPAMSAVAVAGLVAEVGCAVNSRYMMSARCSVSPYLPGRGRLANTKARGLGQWPSLHVDGALAYHLPKWESGRRNLW